MCGLSQLNFRNLCQVIKQTEKKLVFHRTDGKGLRACPVGFVHQRGADVGRILVRKQRAFLFEMERLVLESSTVKKEGEERKRERESGFKKRSKKNKTRGKSWREE